MPRKKLSAETENPMDNEAMETESGSVWPDGESGAEALGQGTEYNALPLNQDERDGDGGGLLPDAPLSDDGPLSNRDSLSAGTSGPSPGEDGLLFGGDGLYHGEDGQTPGGIPSLWGTDSGGSSEYVNGSPDSMGVSPDALSAVLEGVDVPMRGGNVDAEDENLVIPYGEDNPDDDSRPPDGPSFGSLMSGAEMPEGVVNGDAPETADTLPEAAEPAPPEPAEPAMRSAARTRAAARARESGDSPSTASAGVADSPASRTSGRTGAGSMRAESAASAYRTPAPAPVALAPEPARRSIIRQPAGSAADRAAFFGLQFNRLDRNLTPEQRQEWNSIYASYRGRSAMSGTIVGVDRALVQARNPQTGEMDYRHLYFAVVIPYRVRIVIPETEMWFPEEERPNFVLRNMDGAKIDFVIFKVDRENGLAVGSRKMALPTRRYYFSTQPGMNHPGSRIQCNIMAVGPRRCLVNCHGYDLDLTQREMSWKSIPDLRDVYHNGDTLDCIVKEYDSRANRLMISVKETEPNPFDGADFRNPEGCSRVAVITGKYGGGVFCTLPDDVTVMCNYAFQYDDSTFSIGDRVILMVERYEYEKKQVYGKIVAKR